MSSWEAVIPPFLRPQHWRGAGVVGDVSAIELQRESYMASCDATPTPDEKHLLRHLAFLARELPFLEAVPARDVTGVDLSASQIAFDLLTLQGALAHVLQSPAVDSHEQAVLRRSVADKVTRATTAALAGLSGADARRARAYALLHPSPRWACSDQAEAGSGHGSGDAHFEHIRILVREFEAEQAAAAIDARYFVRSIRNGMSFLRYVRDLPTYRRRRRQIRLNDLTLALQQNPAALDTLAAIEHVAPVIDHFALGLNSDTVDVATTAVGELAFLYMQLADELIDALAATIGPEQPLRLLRDRYPQDQWRWTLTPLEDVTHGDLIRLGFDLDRRIEKYAMTVGEMLSELRSVIAAIEKRLHRHRYGAAGRLALARFLQHCFETFLDELYLSGSAPRTSLVDSSWHFYRKTQMVMGYWLAFRAALSGVEMRSRADQIRNWAYLLATFQVFDDLKDIGLDVASRQPNYALTVSKLRSARENEWMLSNAPRFGHRLAIDDVVEFAISCPRTVIDLAELGRLNLHVHADWITRYIADYRWKLSWTGSWMTFHERTTAWVDLLAVPRVAQVFRSIPATGVRAVDVFFGCVAATTSTSSEASFHVDEYLGYVIDLCAYDGAFLVYRDNFGVPRDLFDFTFRRITMPLTARLSLVGGILNGHPAATSLSLERFVGMVSPGILDRIRTLTSSCSAGRSPIPLSRMVRVSDRFGAPR